ncbi:hypothetical protein ACQ0MK_05215 [Thalassospira lucentensis]|uniref:hypothetical protein n=1 Tax=Thalassospira lucentensis TaxID=168935 RepID=UPI003D2ECF9F
MSENHTRKPGRAPGRFVSTRAVLESTKPVKPVRATPIKRFDRKDVMERDLERYRAEARARLLQNGFDIPPFLMPKPKPSEDELEGDEDPVMDPDAQREIRSAVMAGPKPAPLARSGSASSGGFSGSNGEGAKPSRHVHVQAKSQGGGTAPTAQSAAVAREKTAYEEYVESLNGAPRLLDSVGDDRDSSGKSETGDIKGRVDDFKEKEARQSRIDLPENTSNWAARDALDEKRSAMLAKQEKARAKTTTRNNSAPLNWNKIIARFAAYMIAAVAVGYVLVLTVNEFSSILGN